jgi:hypothetical protein
MNTKYKESYEYGRDIEKLFCEVAKRNGIEMLKSSKQDDMYKHIDFWGNGKGYDVKGMRSIKRGEDKQDMWFYVELSNVLGNLGWLFGEADFIVFERKRSFFIVDRIKLSWVVRDVVQLISVDQPRPYKVYTRKGKQDRVTAIHLEDLLMAEPTIWNKA